MSFQRSTDPCTSGLRQAAAEILDKAVDNGWCRMTTITEVYRTKDSKAQLDTMLSEWSSTKRYSRSGSTITATDDRYVVVIVGSEKQVIIRDVARNAPLHDPLLSFKMLKDSAHVVTCSRNSTLVTADIRDQWLAKSGIKTLLIELQEQRVGWHLNRITTEYKDARPVARTVTYAPAIEANVKPMFDRATDLVLDKNGALKGLYRNYSLVDLRA